MLKPEVILECCKHFNIKKEINPLYKCFNLFKYINFL